jgi:hypothetical protein
MHLEIIGWCGIILILDVMKPGCGDDHLKIFIRRTCAALWRWFQSEKPSLQAVLRALYIRVVVTDHLQWRVGFNQCMGCLMAGAIAGDALQEEIQYGVINLDLDECGVCLKQR